MSTLQENILTSKKSFSPAAVVVVSVVAVVAVVAAADVVAVVVAEGGVKQNSNSNFSSFESGCKN